eukprot:CAMPEP_0201590894 /NCGR_PEP_ID=MMETSP0190_2-20130828/183054_1 /ASSEMBLY_ACC=CAM_ASM_000263 /TAXON_ID=37353 /ORGANISM="Rosalina sp." /LENGTH=40 /DNA_ID= /DNA_START= /DNA_END= /DNA_ORIENTATION=
MRPSSARHAKRGAMTDGNFSPDDSNLSPDDVVTIDGGDEE